MKNWFKISSTITFLLFPVILFCQNEWSFKYFYEDEYLRDESYWKKLDRTIPVEQQKQVFERIALENNRDPDKFFGFQQNSEGVHILDLNSDPYLDVIYLSGFGIYTVQVFLGVRDSFQLAMEDGLGVSTRLKYVEKKCVEIVVYAVPYIDPFYFVNTWTIENNDISLKAHQVLIEGLEKPKKFFKQPLNCLVIQDNSSLRENPKEVPGLYSFDNPEDYKYYNENDNILDKYSKGTMGKAWGEVIDKKGEKWWLVEMPAPKVKTYSVFYRDYDGDLMDKVFYIGWMKAANLEATR